jgi:hypothetical protein
MFPPWAPFFFACNGGRAECRRRAKPGPGEAAVMTGRGGL